MLWGGSTQAIAMAMRVVRDEHKIVWIVLRCCGMFWILALALSSFAGYEFEGQDVLSMFLCPNSPERVWRLWSSWQLGQKMSMAKLMQIRAGWNNWKYTVHSSSRANALCSATYCPHGFHQRALPPHWQHWRQSTWSSLWETTLGCAPWPLAGIAIRKQEFSRIK